MNLIADVDECTERDFINESISNTYTLSSLHCAIRSRRLTHIDKKKPRLTTKVMAMVTVQQVLEINEFLESDMNIQ